MLDGDMKQALLIEKLGEIRPDLAFGQNCVMRSGGEADVLIFDTEVARFLRQPNLGQTLREKKMSDEVAGGGAYRVPVVSRLSEDGAINIQSRVAGDVLVPEDHAGGTGTVKFSQLTSAQTEAFARGIGEFAARLHEKSRDGSLAIEGAKSGAFNNPTAKQAVASFIDACPDAKLAESMKKLLAVEEDRRQVLVHGDLGFGNVFVDRNDKAAPAGIIDFGRARPGPPASEFAQMVTMPPAAYHAALSRYNELSSERIEPMQPVLYMAAIYAHAYVHCDNAPQKAHALMRLNQVSQDFLGQAAPAPVPGLKQ